MECVHCGQDAFNRIIINPTTGVEHGGLCEECEASEFGLLAEEPLWHRDSGCGLCPGDADVSIPQLDCVVEWDDGTVDADYSIDHTTLHLCMEHLTAIIDIEEPVTVSPIKTRA